MKYTYIFFIALFLISSCSKKENFRPAIYPGYYGMHGTINDDSVEFHPTGALIKRKNGNYELNVNASNEYQMIYLRFANISLQKADYRIYYTGNYSHDTSFAYYKQDWRSPKEYHATNGWLSIHSIEDSMVKGSYYFTTGLATATYFKGVFAFKPYFVEE